MANQSIYNAFERMWQHVLAITGGKSDSDHTHNEIYYTETEVDTKIAETKAYVDEKLENFTPEEEESTVKDWNENDPESSAYIKNRTHWVEENEGGLSNNLLTNVVRVDNGDFRFNISEPLVIGDTYIVSWDGEEYECVCKDASQYIPGLEALFLGNASLFEPSLEDTNEPFIIGSIPVNDVHGSFDGHIGFVEDGMLPTDANLSVMKIVDAKVYHQLDPRFIPDMYYSEEGKGVKILSETTITAENAEADIAAIPRLGLVTGETYIVDIVGGESYNCTAFEKLENGMTAVCLGCMDPDNFKDGDAPFILMEMPPGIAAAYGINVLIEPTTQDFVLPVTFSIHHVTEKIHYIDPKYIKDMYYEEKIPVVGLPEFTIEDATNPLYTEIALPMTIGAIYTVMWNGVPYICECVSIANTDGTALGNTMLLDGHNNTGEPFLILSSVSENTSVIVRNDDSTSITLSYKGNIIKTHKIPEKYLSSINSNIINGDAIGSLRNPEGSSEYNMGEYALAHGRDVYAIGNYSHAEGFGINSLINTEFTSTTNSETVYNDWKSRHYLMAKGDYSHAEGYDTLALGSASHAEGYMTLAYSSYCHTEGMETEAHSQASHAEGHNTFANGIYSHAEGSNTYASSEASHAEGLSSNKKPESVEYTTQISDIIAAWKGKKFTYANGKGAHAEGRDTLAIDNYTHAEGSETIASRMYAHAEGHVTTASGLASHAEGNMTTASGDYSHAEGHVTTASGIQSHAEGDITIASGDFSHAEGSNTIAKGNYQHVQGKYNIEDNVNKYAHIVGNGELIVGEDSQTENRSNAHTLDWNGNAWYAGSVYVGGTTQTEGSKLATEEFVQSAIEAAINAAIAASY